MGVVVVLKDYKEQKLLQENARDPTQFYFNDRIKASPVGRGILTGSTDVGYPQVNTIAVTWMIREDGLKFDPHGHTLKPGFNEEQWYDVKL